MFNLGLSDTIGIIASVIAMIAIVIVAKKHKKKKNEDF